MNRTDKRIAVCMGKILRAHRRAKDINADKLADTIGVSRANLSRYEKGKINVPSTKLIRWCRALKVKSGDITNAAEAHFFRGR